MCDCFPWGIAQIVYLLSCAKVKNAWKCTSLSLYAFQAQCLIKHWESCVKFMSNHKYYLAAWKYIIFKGQFRSEFLCCLFPFLHVTVHTCDILGTSLITLVWTLCVQIFVFYMTVSPVKGMSGCMFKFLRMRKVTVWHYGTQTSVTHRRSHVAHISGCMWFPRCFSLSLPNRSLNLEYLIVVKVCSMLLWL